MTDDEAPGLEYRLVRVLRSLEAVVVVALIVAILVIATIQVISRYVLNVSAQWTEEIAQLALLWLVFLSAGLVSASDGHVTIRILGGLLGRRGRRFLAGTAYVAVIASAVALIIVGFEPTVARLGLPLPATRWPAGLTYVGVLIGFGLIALHTTINLWILLRGRYQEAPEDIEEAII